METVTWRKSSCNPCKVLVLSLFLFLSPVLSIRSSVPEDGSVGNLHVGLGRQLLGNPDEGLEVELVHRHHPGALGGGRKFSEVGELWKDRILLDAQRQTRQKHQIRARLYEQFPSLSSSDSGSGSYQFVSPEVSGSTLGSGQYFIDFYLGTPPQRFSLIADTGSDVLWVQCTPCIHCYSQIGSLFSPNKSSTYNPLSCTAAECQLIPAPLNSTCDPSYPGVCDYAYTYADGSMSIGVFATETATMNVSKAGKNVRINNVAFGCGFENSGPSLTAAGGIIGLGQGPLSFPSQIGSYFGNQFSYCLVSYLDAPTVSSTLVFGNAGAKFKQQVQSTPFITNQYLPSLYYVGIQCVHVGGNQLAIPSQVWQIDSMGVGGTVVDSGTTLTIFLQPAYLIILNAFVSQINCFPRVPATQGLEFCFDTSSGGGDISRLPSFAVTFDSGAVFSPPNDNIFVSVASNIYCLAMAGSVGPFGYNVLGNLIQQNFQITYNRQAQLFSFAPAQCSSS